MTESLTRSEAHLWITRSDAARDEKLLQAYDRLLTEDERAKCARFRFEKDRHQCLVTRALVRTTLSRYVAVAPEDWRFVTNHYGRPEVAAPHEHRALRFNLSHTKGLVACIVAWDRELGVDVENRARKGRLIDVADRFFSPFEVEALHRVAESDRLDRFFLYWTLKESYIKARGKGLAIPLAHFSFDVDVPEGEEIRIFFDPRLEDDPESWQFTTWRYDPVYAIACGLRRKNERESVRVVLKEIVPLLTDPGESP